MTDEFIIKTLRSNEPKARPEVLRFPFNQPEAGCSVDLSIDRSLEWTKSDNGFPMAQRFFAFSGSQLQSRLLLSMCLYEA